MTPKEIQDIITIASRAPLQNLQEAGAVSMLLAKLKTWHAEVTAPKPSGDAAQ